MRREMVSSLSAKCHGGIVPDIDITAVVTVKSVQRSTRAWEKEQRQPGPEIWYVNSGRH